MSPTKKKQGKARPARGARTAAKKRPVTRSVKRPGRTVRSASGGGGRAAVDQFYADAHAIEVEASARYRVLAREMQASGNARTAELFLKLAQLEAGHADKLEQAAAPELQARAREQLLARKGGQTEVPNYEFLYRDVPPYHALIMALESERLAKAYFERIRENARDPEVKKLAAEFARDEARHVAWLEKALAKEPQPATPSTNFPS
ncbi:MAG TPA: ferritin family protein [Burkholderiales bacterium]|nr:ferritin family protein [Burkholderiales bacterium]